MTLGRFASLLAIVATLAGTGAVLAAPAKSKKATPLAPAKDTGSDAGLGSGSAVEPIEEPPADMGGTNENPDNPHALTIEEPPPPKAVAAKPAGYPTELALRPITLPQNMTEITLNPHFQVSPFLASDDLHARFGITNKIQVGVTYAYGGIWNRALVETGDSNGYGFHAGKAFGIDVTYLIQDWVGVQIGLPFYLSPFAMSLQLAAPMKFHLTDKFALGGLDDLLNITLDNFMPSFYQEAFNAEAAQNHNTNTQQSRGHLRFSVYGIYQQSKEFAFTGRVGLDEDLGESGTGGPGESSTGSSTVYLHAGFMWTPVNYFDLGLQIGFDDLSTSGSFGPQLFLALRI